MGRIVLLLFLLNLALVFAAIVDCLGGEQKPRRWSRLTWSLFIVFGIVVGPLAWFMYGRPGKRLPAPWDNIGSPPTGQRPLAPDDDPDFLADLARRRAAAQPPEPPMPPAEPEEPHDEAPEQPSGDPVRDQRNNESPDERNNGG